MSAYRPRSAAVAHRRLSAIRPRPRCARNRPPAPAPDHARGPLVRAPGLSDRTRTCPGAAPSFAIAGRSLRGSRSAPIQQRRPIRFARTRKTREAPQEVEAGPSLSCKFILRFQIILESHFSAQPSSITAEPRRRKEIEMFTTLAKTLFRASGIAPSNSQPPAPRPWHHEDLRNRTEPKRWEDWR